MVQMIIKLSPQRDEWGLIELQGVLENREEDKLDGKHIGDLHFDSKGTPQMIIGHHLLTGKVIDLDKPYAVLRKVQRSQQSDEIMETDQNQNEQSELRTEYEISALIRKKIIFKTRPKPIIVKTVPIKR